MKERHGIRRTLGAVVVGLIGFGVFSYNGNVYAQSFTPESVAQVTQEKCIAHADQSLEKAQATLFADNGKTFTPEQNNLVRMLTFSACMAQDYAYGHDLMKQLMQQEIDKEMMNND